MALTNAERQRRFRAKQAQKNLFDMKVKGEGGYFDERIRIAIAIKAMAEDGRIGQDFINELLDYSVSAIPPKDLVDERFIRKELELYLGEQQNG